MAERLDADAWIDAGLAAIVEGGPSAVAVEPLARALGVTKGSFYWHFPDRGALLSAIVDRWAARTDELVHEVSAIEAPRERLEALVMAAHRSEPGVRTMRAMSALAKHPELGARVRAIARRRHAFLTECFESLGLPRARAASAARVVHAAYLGVGELDALGVGAKSGPERTAYVEEIIAFVRGLATQPSRRGRR